MKITFLGVGEACDEQFPNTSLWLETGSGESRRSILLDCGFTAPPQYWRHCADPDDLDGVWLSHFHGDHFLGIPALLLRFWEQKRTKPLAIVGQAGSEEKVRQAMELAYPGFLPRLAFPLAYHTALDGDAISALGLRWGFAASGHGQTNLALRISDGRHSVFYSGDGMATEDTLRLAEGCDLMIHEAFRLRDAAPGHGTVTECIEMARRARAGRLALVHVQRDERRGKGSEIVRLMGQVGDVEVLLPEPGDVLNL